MRNILNEEKEKQDQGTLARIKREVRDKSLEKQVELYQREMETSLDKGIQGKEAKKCYQPYTKHRLTGQ